MDKKGKQIRIIVSVYGFNEDYKENRLVVNGISELDSMIITENYDCSKTWI